MRPLNNRIPAAACTAGSAPAPALVGPGFYSPLGEPALVAATPAAWRSSLPAGEGRRRRQAAKESLARFLAQRWLARELPDLVLEQDPLGQPRMRLGAVPGPALSFSWSAGWLWAAVGRPESRLGLDAAAPGEFAGSYPYPRVFGEAEWRAAAALSAGDREEAAALLWSVKEALVKAWGCGFHVLGPRQVQVQFVGPAESGYLWRGEAKGGRGSCPVVAVRLPEVWLAVAWGR